eukprot:scaffold157688_cov35-Prasinocladus_malaysianus.AAC.1
MQRLIDWPLFVVSENGPHFHISVPSSSLSCCQQVIHLLARGMSSLVSETGRQGSDLRQVQSGTGRDRGNRSLLRNTRPAAG